MWAFGARAFGTWAFARQQRALAAGARWPLVCWQPALRPAWRLGLLPLAWQPAGPERRIAAQGAAGAEEVEAGVEPAGDTAARYRAWVQGVKVGSAAKAGRPMFSKEADRALKEEA